MGFFEALRAKIDEVKAENATYEARGLDVLIRTPEIERYCLRKIKRKMMFEFIKPCIFSALVFFIAVVLRFMTYYEEHIAYIFVGAVVVGIPILSYVIFFEGWGRLKSGQYELYGGYCLRKCGNNQVQMNGAYLPVDKLRYESMSQSCYYYILRVPTKKRTMYFFVYTDKSAADSRTGEFYPEDIW